MTHLPSGAYMRQGSFRLL